MKKMLIAAAFAALVSSAAFASEHDAVNNASAAQADSLAAAQTATAAATGYRFVSVCTVLSPTVCPYGPNPIYFGTGANWTLTQCVNAWYTVSRQPLFASYPRTLSTCGIF